MLRRSSSVAEAGGGGSAVCALVTETPAMSAVIAVKAILAMLPCIIFKRGGRRSVPS
jgi:hypothetical protein